MADLESIQVAFADSDYQYPNDKYGPSCLLYENTDDGRTLHIQVSLPPKVKIITVYEPEPDEWENNRVRKVK